MKKVAVLFLMVLLYGSINGQCKLKAQKGDNLIIIQAENAKDRLIKYLAGRGYAYDVPSGSFHGVINDALVGRMEVHCIVDEKSEGEVHITGTWTYDTYGTKLVYPVEYSKKTLEGYNRKVWKWLECLLEEVPYTTSKKIDTGF